MSTITLKPANEGNTLYAVGSAIVAVAPIAIGVAIHKTHSIDQWYGAAASLAITSVAAGAFCCYQTYLVTKSNFNGFIKDCKSIKRLVWDDPNPKYRWGAVGTAIGTLVAGVGAISVGPASLVAIPLCSGAGYVAADVKNDLLYLHDNEDSVVVPYLFDKDSKTNLPNSSLLNRPAASVPLSETLASATLGAPPQFLAPLQFSAAPPPQLAAASQAGILLDRHLPQGTSIRLSIRNQIYNYQNMWSALYACKYPGRAADFVNMTAQLAYDFVKRLEISKAKQDRPRPNWDDQHLTPALYEILAQLFASDTTLKTEFRSKSDQALNTYATFINANRGIKNMGSLLISIRNIIHGQTDNGLIYELIKSLAPAAPA